MQVPSLLDVDFFAVRDAVLKSQQLAVGFLDHCVDFAGMPELTIPNAPSRQLGSWVAISNVQRELGEWLPEITVEVEVKECLQNLQGISFINTILGYRPRLVQGRLAEFNLTLSHCANINIYLSSMDLFPRVNSVYKTFFGISPPARACVGVDLPPNIQVKLDCIAYAEQVPMDMQALHVQGLSYWAPANIGPYSQAIIVC